jgi:hypothetical protein
MDHAPARTVVLARALPAAFEAACLLHCADVSAAGRRRAEPPTPTTGAAEFDQPPAATRLTWLLTALGYDATQERISGGGRRQYHLQRVVLPDPQRIPADRMLGTAWRQGRLVLLQAETLGASALRHAQRATLAHAAWRAALLAGGRRRRADMVGVSLGDQDMSAVLVRAARLVGVTAEVTRRPGCLIVAIPPAAASYLMATRLPTAIPA